MRFRCEAMVEIFTYSLVLKAHYNGEGDVADTR